MNAIRKLPIGIQDFEKLRKENYLYVDKTQYISLNEKFAEICGISETELLQNFQPEIQALSERRKISYNEAVAKLKQLYDGYHFAKESADIYNPFSLLNTFDNLDLAYYWFQTGTPTFLAKALRNQNYDIRELEDNVYISANDIMNYRIEYQNLVPLLYQSGYLTIKSYEEDEDAYVLGFPNEEVKYGFLNELLRYPLFYRPQKNS